MMGVKPEDYSEFTGIPVSAIFAVVADQYGRKLADELAAMCWKAYKSGDWPRVVWPTF